MTFRRERKRRNLRLTQKIYGEDIYTRDHPTHPDPGFDAYFDPRIWGQSWWGLWCVLRPSYLGSVIMRVMMRTSTLVSGVSHNEGYDAYFDPRIWGQSWWGLWCVLRPSCLGSVMMRVMMRTSTLVSGVSHDDNTLQAKCSTEFYVIPSMRFKAAQILYLIYRLDRRQLISALRS